MFSVNQTVSYSVTGVCKIVNIEHRMVQGEDREFYVLQPVFDPNSTVMVPTENQMLTQKMHPVMSKSEVESLINEIPDEQPVWVENDRERYEAYKSIIQSGDRRGVVGLIKALYLHRKEQIKKGRKLRSGDERIMREAERVLYSEFALALDMKPDEILPFLKDKLGAVGA